MDISFFSFFITRLKTTNFRIRNANVCQEKVNKMGVTKPRINPSLDKWTKLAKKIRRRSNNGCALAFYKEIMGVFLREAELRTI